jgi:hypothetical protein
MTSHFHQFLSRRGLLAAAMLALAFGGVVRSATGATLEEIKKRG